MPAILTSPRHADSTFALPEILRQILRPLFSEDPLVRVYTLCGLGLMAAGAIAPHGAGWAVLGVVLLAFCCLWQRSSGADVEFNRRKADLVRPVVDAQKDRG